MYDDETMSVPSPPQAIEVDVPGTRIVAWRWRRSARDPGAPAARIVFAHGITDDGRCWEPIVATLLDTHEGAVDAVAYDARGHGYSQPLGCAGSLVAGDRSAADHLAAPRAVTNPPPNATLARLADDLIAVVRTVGFERPLLVGHSMGAVTVVVAESRAPGLAGGLFLEDPPSPWSHQSPLPQEAARGDAPPPLPEWLVPLRGRDPAEILVHCRSHRPEWSEEERRHWARSKSAVAADVGWLFAALREDWSLELDGVQCPTLVVAGNPARGGVLTAADATRLVATLPKGRFETIPGAGHNVRRDALAPYLDLLRGAIANGT
ncbi:MAG: alpha/beta hydrolase [Polyangiaceae bacterium]|nr:alpha/beta hydrolase [Polyangiaceae bacterium]